MPICSPNQNECGNRAIYFDSANRCLAPTSALDQDSIILRPFRKSRMGNSERNLFADQSIIDAFTLSRWF
jgi:hypothetical protein